MKIDWLFLPVKVVFKKYQKVQAKRTMFHKTLILVAEQKQISVNAAPSEVHLVLRRFDLVLIILFDISADKPINKSDKGINFPDTDFNISPVTDFDKECLPFIIANADMVGFSFVNNAADSRKN